MSPTTAFLFIFLITLPQWFLMLRKPSSKWTQRLVDSDIIPFFLLLIYVSSIAQTHKSNLNFSSIENLVGILFIEDLALGAWAFLGFLSLVISGWLFNRTKTLELSLSWVIPSFLVLLIVSPILIWLIRF